MTCNLHVTTDGTEIPSLTLTLTLTIWPVNCGRGAGEWVIWPALHSYWLS